MSPVLARSLRVPCGHTSFSWGRCGRSDSPSREAGHTPFSLFAESPLAGAALIDLHHPSADRFMREACQCLSAQWPAVAAENRLKAMKQQRTERGRAKSFGLVELCTGKCIGHARVQNAADDGEGAACAVTSVVVEYAKRGQGYGLELMKVVEEEARTMGYTFVYLWTSTAEEFYAKCGYAKCEKVNLALPIMKKLDEKVVFKIESVLDNMFKRQNRLLSRGLNADQQEVNSQDEQDHGSPNDANVVWMRKRLLESLPSIMRPKAELLEEIERACRRFDGKFKSWKYFLIPCPWQKQVGPSCGLAALRMAQECIQLTGGVFGEESGGSLLNAAIERGYSNDGEIFNIDWMNNLAKDVSKMNAEVVSFSHDFEFETREVVRLLLSGNVLVLPYDRGLGDSLPSMAGGSFAHYALIVGFVLPSYQCSSVPPALVEWLVDRDDQDLFRSADVLLIGQHGMGRQLLISSAESWLNSNGQLCFESKQVVDLLEKRNFSISSLKLQSVALKLDVSSSNSIQH